MNEVATSIGATPIDIIQFVAIGYMARHLFNMARELGRVKTIMLTQMGKEEELLK